MHPKVPNPQQERWGGLLASSLIDPKNYYRGLGLNYYKYYSWGLLYDYSVMGPKTPILIIEAPC